jgi:hypothetical protein
MSIVATSGALLIAGQTIGAERSLGHVIGPLAEGFHPTAAVSIDI